MKQTVIDLTKQLIQIPSYVGKNANEGELATFVFDLLASHGFKPSKQYIDDKRFNVVVRKGKPRLWLCAHMDTVEPKNENDCKGRQVDNRLYGLGAVDMKGGLAAILSAVCSIGTINNLGLLFYCDEEYNFKGMKKFLKKFTGKPELVIIPESTNMQMSNAHRGLIELSAVIKGKTGHASRPEEGVNAIMQVTKAITEMASELEAKYSNPDNGVTTCTLSRIQGGLQIGGTGNAVLYAAGTNSIPDTAEIWLDIRPAVGNLRGQQAIQLLKRYIQKYGCTVRKTKITQDLGPLITPKSQLATFENILKKKLGKKEYLPGEKMGYGDGQLFFEKTGSPVIYFGPGPSSACHKEGEYVLINDVISVAKVLKEVIKLYGK